MLEVEPTSREVDLELCRAAASGDMSAWHQFVKEYSGLVFSVIRRYFPSGDEDERRTVYVDILEHFYRSGLKGFSGRASLSTWVATVTRTRCIDILRSARGRRRPPEWLQRLSGSDREIYQRHFVRGEEYAAIAGAFRQRGEELTHDGFLEALERLESGMDPAFRTRIAYDLQARSLGMSSGRMLQFLDHLRLEQEEAAEAMRPDYQLFLDRAQQTLRQVRECVMNLEKDEKEVVLLHVCEDLPANVVARRLGLASQRRVYTLASRAIRNVREMLGRPFASGEEKGTSAEPSSRSTPVGGR